MTLSQIVAPSEWIQSRFTELAVRNSNSRTPKVAKSTYQIRGRFPVVDQGQEMVAGYVDNEDLRFRGQLPVIVFGDHTRIFKYVDFPFVAGADGTRIIAPHLDRLDVSFFYYALCNLPIKNLGYSRHFKLLKEQIIQYPQCLREQQKIAAILSSVDDAIEKTRAVIDQVQIVKRGLMQELLTRGLPERHTRFKQTEMGEIPEGWIIKTVAEIGKVVTGSTPNTNNQVFWNGTIPFVTPADLGGTKVRITGRSVSEEGLAQVREIPSGTVMVTCIGASIGKLGISVERCCTNQQINSIIPGNSILSEYLHYALSLTSRTLVGLAGVTAVPIVSKSRFLTLRILVPSLTEQEQIARVLSGADYLIEVNQARLAALTEVKQALMPILLTGELRVTPDPDAA